MTVEALFLLYLQEKFGGFFSYNFHVTNVKSECFQNGGKNRVFEKLLKIKKKVSQIYRKFHQREILHTIRKP